MNYLFKHIILGVFATSQLCSCSILRPVEQPFLATEYLHQVEMEGAAEFAPEEYRRVLLEYSQLEKLHRARQYDAVNKGLPLFSEQADQLLLLVRQNIKKAEAQAAAPPAPARIPAASVKEEVSVTTESERIAKPRLSYTVSEGELLWSIAKRPDVYGDPLLWPLLYQANRDQIKDPRIIYAGQTLSIPRNISDEEREKARNLAKKSDIFSLE